MRCAAAGWLLMARVRGPFLRRRAERGNTATPGGDSDRFLLTRTTIASIMSVMVRRRRKRSPRQQSLNFDAGRHGGSREGSGRPEGPNPKLWHRSRDEFAASHPLHVTVPVRWDVPRLRSYRIVRAIEATFR